MTDNNRFFKNENMTLEYLIDKYIEKTGYGMDMWSKEENAVMTTVAEIIEESKVNKISSNTLLADSCPTCGHSPCMRRTPLGNCT